MADLAVTPDTRALGWNVVFYCGHLPQKFAGVFQAEGSDLITFRDVVDEMRLCFQFQVTDPVTRNQTSHQNNTATDGDISTDYWDNIEFALMDRPDQPSIPKLIRKDTYNTPVPSLPRLSPNTPDIINYHVYIHRTCDLPVSSPLTDHLGDQCAQHLSEPIRRHHPRQIELFIYQHASLHWTLGFAVRHGDGFTLHFRQHAAFQGTSGRGPTLHNEALDNTV
ncbi:hypothetical protein FGLOB1_8891 [Fusarium globosum]|uniref:Uncharacterized protein n=1 Tax=Fusarium globosum TaxID=78864 RepID=A0A8H5Y102_9HYPO|nr:hypothetical protein FGLOB1_8891 [Fusarium globosum]